MNKPSVFRIAIGILFSFLLGETGFSQGSPESKIRLYNHIMNPRQYPDDQRRPVHPPDADLLGNRLQFISLRWFDDNYKSTIDKYTTEYNLGNILWPVYSFLYRSDFKDIIAEIKRRNLFLFDIWGYVPGSGPGTAGQKNELGSVYSDPYFWQQFIVSPSTFSYLEKELGPRWLGMDNGEQDGRYIGGYADQMNLTGSSREHQYLNFQNHFQGLGDRLGNKLAALVSLNFGHYFLKEGIYTMIGAETAQALPNSQVYYSFIRGVGKQYGVPWFGNASVWNRWGAKNYEGFTSMDGTMGKTKGTSLSLLKRLMVNHIMYNCVAVGFESGFLDEKGNLSPIGKIQQSMNQWVQKYGNPGTMYTPVAVLCDFFSGWSFPRHLYTSHVFRVWGNLPYKEGDYLTDGLLAMLYPEYRDASYFHDETGFISSTPHGDIADCILSDAPLWLLKQYPVLVVGGELTGGHEIKDKLEEYVRAGGQLVITAGSLSNLPEGLLGVRTGQKEFSLDQGTVVAFGDHTLTEESGFTIKEIVSSGDATILASCPKGPLAMEYRAGSGKMIVFASPFGVGSDPTHFVESKIDQRFDSPYPLLKHVSRVMDQIFSATEIFTAGEGLSLITCSKNKNEYTVAISNNTWQEKSFALTSNFGKIIFVDEWPLKCSERKAVGFVPEGVTGNLGKNSKKTIAGGDIRVFSVKLETNVIEEKPEVLPVPNPEKRGLTLRNIVSVKEEILLRPTFFRHFDRVVIDWKYLEQREEPVLAKESEWIKRQGLKLIVDFSSGVNLFPDLRLINNHPEYAENRKTISSVMRKMKVIGSGDMVLPLHRMVENNISWDQYLELLRTSLRDICREAALNNVDVHIKSVQGGSLKSLEQLSELVKTVNEPNLYVAPSTAMLLYHKEEYAKAVKSLKNEKIRFCFVSAPELDNYKKIWNTNCPVHRYPDPDEVRVLLNAVSGNVLILDGIYPDKDEEYLDVKIIENL
ncbi:MAG: hypothetical protein AB2L24_09590 [Mangrovibacterium sp.]